MSNPVIINKVVEANQIDHNNHMHDSEYNKVFSEAVNEFNYTHGLSLKGTWGTSIHNVHFRRTYDVPSRVITQFNLPNRSLYLWLWL